LLEKHSLAHPQEQRDEDMTTGIANSKATDEAQIRALIDDRAKAVCDKSVNEASLNRTLPKAFRQTQNRAKA